MAKIKEKDALTKAVGLIEEYRNHWEPKYAGVIKDYRRMASGKLPIKIETELARDEYLYRSKLIPRLIVDSIELLRGTMLHSLLDREDQFQIVGRFSEDHPRAKNINDLVKYAFEVTNYRTTVSEILQDALEVGIGFGEVVHDIKKHPVTRIRNVLGMFPTRVIAQEVIYDGPRLKYEPVESIYLEPVRRIEQLTAYAKLKLVSISSIRANAGKGGIYEKYAGNIDKLKNVNPEDPYAPYDISTDHTQSNILSTPDYKVLIGEVWMQMESDTYGPPEWYLVTVGNYNADPVLLRFEKDPMGTGTHPLVICRAFPKNNRMLGEAAPEKLYHLFLEQFHKRNQRIDYANQVIAINSSIIVGSGQTKKDSLAFGFGKFIELNASSASDVKTIQMDTTPIQLSLQEEDKIEQDVLRTMHTNEVTSGLGASRREAATTNSIIDENAKVLQSDPLRSIEDSLIKPIVQKYIADFQVFSKPEFIIRVLGKAGEPIFMDYNVNDILGSFDVICKASSEIIPKAVKQNMYAQFAQLYQPSPKVNIDWNEFARQHAGVMEMNNVDKIIRSDAWEMAAIEREEGLMLNGFPWEPLENEPHEMHITHHMQTLQESKAPQTNPMEGQEQGQMLQNQQQLDTTSLENHIQMTQQMMAQLNGQMNMPKNNMSGSQGDVMDSATSQIAPKNMTGVG